RRVPKSIHELAKAVKDSFEFSGISAADAAHLQLKLLRYMTSCPDRRATYESQSWWEFVEADRLGTKTQRYLDSSPQMLVAMRAKECDARTIGNIAVQLFLDQLTQGERTDCTLSGPTTTAWFVPWRRHLVRQGVQFIQGRLLELREQAGRVIAIVE